jgi:uncharacterized protein
MTSSNTIIVEQVFKALGQGDLAEATNHFDAGICIYEPANLPYGGKYVGHAGFYALFKQLGIMFDQLSIPPSAIVDAGRAVIAMTTLRARIKATGISVQMPLNEVFVLKAGKIVEIRPFYWDTAAIARAIKNDVDANAVIHDPWAAVVS